MNSTKLANKISLEIHHHHHHHHHHHQHYPILHEPNHDIYVCIYKWLSGVSYAPVHIIRRPVRHGHLHIQNDIQAATPPKLGCAISRYGSLSSPCCGCCQLLSNGRLTPRYDVAISSYVEQARAFHFNVQLVSNCLCPATATSN